MPGIFIVIGMAVTGVGILYFTFVVEKPLQNPDADPTMAIVLLVGFLFFFILGKAVETPTEIQQDIVQVKVVEEGS